MSMVGLTRPHPHSLYSSDRITSSSAPSVLMVFVELHFGQRAITSGLGLSVVNSPGSPLYPHSVHHIFPGIGKNLNVGFCSMISGASICNDEIIFSADSPVSCPMPMMISRFLLWASATLIFSSTV